jgi:hypothetical protein
MGLTREFSRFGGKLFDGVGMGITSGVKGKGSNILWVLYVLHVVIWSRMVRWKVMVV